MNSSGKLLKIADLHAVFLQAISSRVISHSDLAKKPLEIDLRSPLPHRVRLYMFNATHPPGGRTLGEHKVQLCVPGQRREEEASFDSADGRIILLCGYVPDTQVFVLWDSAFYPRFVFSRNIQVKPQTVYQALAGQIGQQLRRVRSQGTEVVLTANARLLPEAVELRMNIARKRMMAVARLNDDLETWCDALKDAEKEPDGKARAMLRAQAGELVKRLKGEDRELIPQPSLKKCVFVGTINGQRVLLHAETGDIVVEITKGMRPKEMAYSRGLNLIARRNALSAASEAYEKVWQATNEGRWK